MARFGSRLLIALLAPACSDSDPMATPEWQAVFSATPSALLRVWGTSAEDVYVVGANTDDAGAVGLHYDGETWRRIAPPAPGSLWWVQGVGPDDIRMVGDQGTALRYTPSTGEFEVRPTPTDLTLFGVWGASSTDVWYVGGSPGLGRGVILRDDGTTVREVMHTATASAAFFKVQGLSANAVWMVGQQGRALLWNGSELEQHDTGSALPLMGVHGTRPDQVFAVGGVADGVLFRWDGSTWTNETPAATPQMIGVWSVDAETTYAAGFNGRIFRRSAGGQWAELPEMLPTFQDLHAIWVDELGHIWSVGGRLAQDPPTEGVLIRYGPPIGNEITE